MNYFIKEIKKRKTNKLKVLDRNVLSFYPDNNYGQFYAKGGYIERSDIETLYYVEAYVGMAYSFFNILAKALSKAKIGSFDKFVRKNQHKDDEFIRYLADFNKKWFPIFRIRHKAVHKESVIKDVIHFYEISGDGWEQYPENLDFKYLVTNIDRKNVSLVDYLDKFHKEFETLFNEKIKDNLTKIY